MIPPPSPEILREAARRALEEDRGPGDITTQIFVPAQSHAKARIFAKERCVLAGLPVAEAVFREEDPSLRLTAEARDGDALEPGATVLRIEGALHPLLVGERPALNYLQRLSGIATLTRRFVDALAGTKTRLLDTRKTTPGLRHLEKYAVLCGGGTNHRTGLHDHFLVKDNHWTAFDPATLRERIAAARALKPNALLEFEADTLDQVRLLLKLDVDRILLDNMGLEEMETAVREAAGRVELEASGNMTLARVPAVGRTGVDFISVGALTHSATAVDFSLEVLS
ncbi:MAG: carboxylating nicotinate-nucleotide diphosphorylase [Verrucomicrobium sp.]|nr:carboxylating nicotinate-nucleotide diphosphorylase [Verrucomicrobium sp.]